MIRTAQECDRPAMLRMGRDFLQASGLPLTFEAAYADACLSGHMASDDTLSLVLDLDGCACGMLCAGITSSPLAPVRIASELLFWIDPGARGFWARPMITAYCDWAKEQGCQMAGLATVGSRGADALYQRCGFEPAERHFLQVL